MIGAKGMLGTKMLQNWQSYVVIAADSVVADIRDETQVRSYLSRVVRTGFALTAAYTDVDGSENNRDLAFAVNETPRQM